MEITSVDIAVAVFISAMISICAFGVVMGILSSEKIYFQKAKVTSVFERSSNTACYYDRNGNTDYDYPCPFHVGDNVTVYSDGAGVWHIQK